MKKACMNLTTSNVTINDIGTKLLYKLYKYIYIDYVKIRIQVKYLYTALRAQLESKREWLYVYKCKYESVVDDSRPLQIDP